MSLLGNIGNALKKAASDVGGVIKRNAMPALKVAAVGALGMSGAPGIIAGLVTKAGSLLGGVKGSAQASADTANDAIGALQPIANDVARGIEFGSVERREAAGLPSSSLLGQFGVPPAARPWVLPVAIAAGVGLYFRRMAGHSNGPRVSRRRRF